MKLLIIQFSPAVIPFSLPAVSGLDVKLTTHLHLVPKSKNAWRYTSTPQYASMVWSSAKRKECRQLYFTVTLPCPNILPRTLTLYPLHPSCQIPSVQPP